MSNRFKPYATVALIIEHEGKYLVVEEYNDDQDNRLVFGNPCGHIDGKETITDAALREGYEETGCRIELLSLISINDYVKDNETIYQAVDVIHSAIYANRQIRFKYCEWTVNKKLVQRKNGADYIVSPWSLTWDDENYYLVAYDEAVGQIRHYRVDKMQERGQLETARKGREQFENFDLAAFAKKTFGMFGGKDEKVTLVCRNELAGVILDRFGTDIMMIPSGPDCFRTPVTVSVSSQFFGWLTGIGSGIRIESPAEVKEEYKRYLQGILEAY